MSNKGIFVKLNCKDVREINNLIYSEESEISQNKYSICAGKYDKNGWTIIFKTKTVDEAQELIDINEKISEDTRFNSITISSNLEKRNRVLC